MFIFMPETWRKEVGPLNTGVSEVVLKTAFTDIPTRSREGHPSGTERRRIGRAEKKTEVGERVSVKRAHPADHSGYPNTRNEADQR